MNWLELLAEMGLDPLRGKAGYSTYGPVPTADLGSAERRQADLRMLWHYETVLLESQSFQRSYELSREPIERVWRIAAACSLVQEALRLGGDFLSVDRGRLRFKHDDFIKQNFGEPPKLAEASGEDATAAELNRLEREAIEKFELGAQAWLKSPSDMNKLIDVCRNALVSHRKLEEEKQHLSFVLKALQVLGSDAAAAIPDIVEAGSWANNRAACDALTTMGLNGLAALAEIVRRAHGDGPFYAAATMASFGVESIPFLAKCLFMSKPASMAAAAKALALFGREAASAAPKLHQAWAHCKEVIHTPNPKSVFHPPRLACEKALRAIVGVNYFDVPYGLSYDEFIHENIKKNTLTGPNDPLLERPIGRGVEPRRSAMLDGLMETVPSGLTYDELTRQLGEINHELKERFIERLQPVLNAEAQGRPHETLEQKRELASWINDELAKLDLAVKYPGTELPARLGSEKGNHPKSGRFEIQYYNGGDRRRHRPDTLPNLELTRIYDPNSWRDKEDRKGESPMQR